MHLNNQVSFKITGFALVVFFLISLSSFAQQNYEPKILILTPAKTSISSNLNAEFKAQSDTISIIAAKAKGREQQKPISHLKNIQLMTDNAYEFLINMTFFKQVSYISQSYLSYRFYERFPNELILIKDTLVSAKISDMQKLAEQQNMDYIVSYPTIDLFKQNDVRQSKLSIQLYERSSNSFLIDQVYIGDQDNHGFEFACNEGSINCIVNNALSIGLNDVLKEIAGNNPTLKKERQLNKDRAEILQNKLFNENYDIMLVKQVIPVSDSSIHLNKLYHTFVNPEKTQFVSFFAETGISNNFRTLNDHSGDQKVNIITSKNIGDPGYLDSIPKTYAYMVEGVKYNGKWYYQKNEITYFDAPTLKDGQLMYFSRLREWGYFKQNSTEYSPDFWNGALFKKVIDRTKDPNWEEFKAMWATEERENRDYVGIYIVVANQLKRDKKIEAANFQKNHSKRVLEPFFKKQIESKSSPIHGFNKILDEFVLIYPKDKHVILTPLKVTDKQGTSTLRYFVTFPDNPKVYEWTYFKSMPINDDASEEVISNISSLALWNFSYDRLDNAIFWDKYVLLKESGSYRYLQLLN